MLLGTFLEIDDMNFSPLSPHVNASFLRAILRVRRLRSEYLGKNNFSDAAWDILLELFAGHLEGQCVTLDSLCDAALTPKSTCLRWLKKLEADGLVEQSEQTGEDARVGLTSTGAAAMLKYFAAISAHAQPI